MASTIHQIDKPQHGHSKRAEIPDLNINTGAQSINTERASLSAQFCMVTGVHPPVQPGLSKFSPQPPPVENDTFITPVTLIMQKKSILCNYSCCTLGWGGGSLYWYGGWGVGEFLWLIGPL